MHASVWRLRCKPGKEKEFEELYGPGGLWAALFHESRAYHGTIVLRSQREPLQFTLIDFWTHRDDYDALRQDRREPYDALDRAGAELTESEEHVGWFDDVA